MAGRRAKGGGRKPKPQQIKIAEGNRSKASKATLARQEPRGIGRPRVPAHLSADERTLFVEALDSLPEGVLTRADEGMLERYACAYARWRKCGEMITQTGLLVQTPNGPARNPLLAVQNSAAKEMHAAGAELGLSPVSRARLAGGSIAAPEPTDPMEQLLGMEAEPAWAAGSETRQ